MGICSTCKQLFRFLGSWPNLFPYADGILQAEVATAGQSAKLSILQTLDGTPVKVVLHYSLNFVKGIN